MNNPLEPRYDSKPTQPKDPGEMTYAKQVELFDATMDRNDVADRVWDAILDEITPDQHREVVRTLFKSSVTRMADLMEAGRIIYRVCPSEKINKIVESEEHNTDMSKDDV